jgi:hypothetical protein
MFLRSLTYFLALSVLIQFSAGCVLVRGITERVVLPDSFSGDVLIFFEMDDGVSPEYDGIKVIYRIPPNGILKLRSAPTKRSGATEYVYETKDGIRHLEYVDHWGNDRTSMETLSDSEKRNGVYVFNDGGGTFNVAGRVVRYRGILVGHPSERSRMYDSMVNRMFQVQRSMLNGS